MSDPSHRRGKVTRLLAEVAEGRSGAMGELMEQVYPELRRLAAAHLRSERPGITLQATALINEAYIRLIDQRPEGIRNRAHFFGIGSRLMRQILVDYARSKAAQKRGAGQQHVNISDAVVIAPDRLEEVLLVDEALKRLAQVDSRQARVVEMRFYGGLSILETAQALRLSPATVKREWRMARAWLFRELRQGDPPQPP